MVMKWLNNNKDIKFIFVLFIVFLVGMTSYTIGHTQAVTMWEDEMIVVIDDYEAMQDEIDKTQKEIDLFLAGKGCRND